VLLVLAHSSAAQRANARVVRARPATADPAAGARGRAQVDTDMCRSIRAAMGVPEANRGKGLLAADDSAGRVAAHIERLDASTSGTFWAADTGEVLSW
jgi:hypothetical protein